ncbi:MAG: hypothetical protein IJ248_04760 [Candidatus Methanomethylophilaceae archaeon]|nr:hypothetical protein [Candidatus Methanomethylophilaceae archaeon]
MIDHRRLLNESPAVIGMMTSVLQSGGSIDTAIRSVADSGPRQSRKMFSNAVRIADTKGAPSLTDALAKEISDLPKEASGYGRSVLMILSAAVSSDEETSERMIRDSADIALYSVREMGESYGASLTVPCMTVFGIGIMIPLIMMSILPMLSIGGLFGSKTMSHGMIATITLAIVPSMILIVALHIRGRNPFLSDNSPLTGLRYALPILSAIPLAFVFMYTGTDPEWIFLFSLVPACVAAIILMGEAVHRDRRRSRCEMSLMDSIFDLGNRMLSETNFEKASVDSIAARDDSADVSKRLAREYALCRGDIRSAISSVIGPISSEMTVALQNIQMCSEKNNDDAGKLAVTLGKQFQNRNVTKRDLDMKLKSTTDMMVGTAMFFAPMVLGMSIAMLEPLSSMAGYVPMQNTSTILNIYLVELSAMISILVSSLGNEEGIPQMVWRFCLMCPISLLVFAICCSISL